ncbi:MAG: SDR family NAD(P)-dependent oxidoreductase [Rhizobiaceae bacterium]
MKALITGGSQGLGAALVRCLIARGAQVCIVDRVPPTAQAGVAFVRCDLSDMDAIAGLALALPRAGPFDLVVMSAGISAVGAFETLPADTIEEVLDVNCLAPILLSRELLASGLIARGGRLVFVSSLSHFTGYPGASVYAASKDALVAFARSVRRPLRVGHGIIVQVVTPGPMRTAHAVHYAPPGSTGKGRADPDHVARVILRARRRLLIVPGLSARLMAILGRIFPGIATRAMRRIIFERLT